MKNLFRLRYGLSDSAINLDKEENSITGESLKNLGVQIYNKFAGENIFTIIKYEFEGILNWKIINNLKDKDVFVNSRNNPTKHSEIKISPGEIHRLKMLLDEKIYFNANNSHWDYFYFDKIKIDESREINEIISRKIENEPIDIENDELDELFLYEDRPVIIEKVDRKTEEGIVYSQNELNVCRIEDDEEEIQRSSIFKNEKSLEELLLEYNLDENSSENSVEAKKKNGGEANNRNEVGIKNPGINVHNIQTIPTKSAQVSQVSKVNKIITDDEEDSPTTCQKGLNAIKEFSIKNDNATCSSMRTTYKIIQSSHDEVYTESMLNEILEHYKESTSKNCIDNIKAKDNYNETFKSDYYSSNHRDNLIKAAVMQGTEFNSNNKRIRPVSYSKEIDEHFSAFKTKRLKKATENKELKIDTNTTCAICLENITALANLDNCTHDFCKPCIIEWSTKYSNVCPLCKKDFKKIIYYEKNKKKELKVKKKKFKLEEEEEDYGLFDNIVEDSADNCMVCNSNSDFPNMLVCDGCHYNVCHTYCDGLDAIPYEDWFCSECRGAERNNRRQRQYLIDNIELEEDDDNDDSYEPQIQLNEEVEELEEYILDDLFKDEFSERKINQSQSSSRSNDSNIQLASKNKRGRPRKMENHSNNSNNNFNNLSVNISVNVNMSTTSRRGRRPKKNNNELLEDYRRPSNSNNNLLVNSSRNESLNLNNIRLNSSIGNFNSRDLSNERNHLNNFNNINTDNNLNVRNIRNNFSGNTLNNERSKRGRPKNR